MAIELTQELTLPSQGLLNPEIPDGKVVQRCMMVSDQKTLSGSNQSSKSSINQLIQNTITAPETFDVSRLTVPDTLYLLFKLRILSYGNTYKFRTRCPECGKKITVNCDLSELQVDLLDEDYQDKLSTVLPHREDTVFIKILTNEDMDNIEKEIKRRKKRSAADESEYVLRIAKSIDKIVLKSANKDGKKELTNSIDIERYISALTDLDAATILATRDEAVFGVSPVIETTCPECREEIEVGIQFAGDFFRPSISK